MIHIPKIVCDDSRLRDGDKLLFGYLPDITSLSNAELAALRSISVSGVAHSIARLAACGYVSIENNGRNRVIHKSYPQVINIDETMNAQTCKDECTNVHECTNEQATMHKRASNHAQMCKDAQTCKDDDADRNTVDFRSIDLRSIDLGSRSLKEDRKDGGMGEGKEGTKKRGEDDPQFRTFWAAYPRKVCKAATRKVWEKLAPDAKLFSEIMAGLKTHKAREWVGREERMIPHATTWLNQRRFEDGDAASTSSNSEQDERGFTCGRNVPAGAERLAARGGDIDWQSVPDFT